MLKRGDFFIHSIDNCSNRKDSGRMEQHKDQQSLTEMKEGQTGTIITVLGGHLAAKRLADMGITPGIGVRLIRKTLFKGPVQIEVRGSSLVLGRGLASKIMVEPDERQ